MEDVHYCVADAWGDFVESESFVGEEEFRVRPGAPFGGVDVVDEGVLLGGREEGEEVLGCFDDLCDWELLVLEWEEIGTDFACGLLVDKLVEMIDMQEEMAYRQW